MKSQFTIKTFLSIILFLFMLFAAMGTSTMDGSLRHRKDELEDRIHRLWIELECIEMKISEMEQKLANLRQEYDGLQKESEIKPEEKEE